MEKRVIEHMLDAVNWEAIDPTPDVAADGIPHATHEGLLEIGGFALRVYQLSDGRRVIEGGDLERLFGAATGSGAGADKEEGGK